MPDDDQNAGDEARELLAATLRDLAQRPGDRTSAGDQMRAALALAELERGVFNAASIERMAKIINGGAG